LLVRTTVNIDEEVLELVHRFAESRSISLGKAISELARRGLEAERRVRKENGLYVVELPEGSPEVSSRRVRDLDAEST
jgi:hypothetical protein